MERLGKHKSKVSCPCPKGSIKPGITQMDNAWLYLFGGLASPFRDLGRSIQQGRIAGNEPAVRPFLLVHATQRSVVKCTRCRQSCSQCNVKCYRCKQSFFRCKEECNGCIVKCTQSNVKCKFCNERLKFTTHPCKRCIVNC